MSNPKEMIEEGLRINDLEMVRKGYELMNAEGTTTTPIIPDKELKRVGLKEKRKYTRKKKGIKKKDKPVKKAQFAQSDAEFGNDMYQKYLERYRDITEGKASPLVGTPNLFTDNTSILKSEQAFDKKTAKIKKVQKRRPPTKFIKVICPRCGKSKQITDGEAALYTFDMNDDSDKPVYSCGQCTR